MYIPFEALFFQPSLRVQLRAIALSLVLLTPAHSRAQDGRLGHPFTHQSTRVEERSSGEGALTLTLMRGDSLIETRVFDPEEELRVIVEFTAPSLARVGAEGLSSASEGGSTTRDDQATSFTRAARAARLARALSEVEAEHARFRADLARLEAEEAEQSRKAGGSSTGGPLGAPQALPSRVTSEYRHSLNGLALTTRRRMLARLRGLSYIRTVSPDTPVILLSAFAEVLGLDEKTTGADAVISKNANEVTHLLRCVTRLLRRPARKAPRRYHAARAASARPVSLRLFCQVTESSVRYH